MTISEEKYEVFLTGRQKDFRVQGLKIKEFRLKSVKCMHPWELAHKHGKHYFIQAVIWSFSNWRASFTDSGSAGFAPLGRKYTKEKFELDIQVLKSLSTNMQYKIHSEYMEKSPPPC